MTESAVRGTGITADLEEQQRRVLGQVYGMLLDLVREKRAAQKAQSGDLGQAAIGDLVMLERG